MDNKFNLTREQNIFLAKRNIVDYIWRSANLEGIALTYPETQTIFDGVNVGKYSIDELTAINNLKHTWRFILEDVDIPTTYSYIYHINELIGINLFYNAGKIRTTPVSIGGTKWQPNLPIESKIKEELDDVLKINNPTEKAINMMLWLMRGQLFIDGNKRTAMMVANKIMIENGCGIITIPVEIQTDFYKLLIEFYETNNNEKVLKFIYDNCIDGIIFTEEN